MRRAVRRDGDTIRVELESWEADLLRSLPQEMRAMLETADASDPAVARLFPAVAPDDEDTDAEVRRLIFDDLLRERLDGLDAVAAVLERGVEHRGRVRVDLRDDEPALLLGVLNDVRLTLGARIGVEHLDRDAIDLEHPAAPTVAVMDHLAWMQEQLLRAIDPASVGDDD